MSRPQIKTAPGEETEAGRARYPLSLLHRLTRSQGTCGGEGGAEICGHAEGSGMAPLASYVTR